MEEKMSREQLAALLCRVRESDAQAFGQLLDQYKRLINGRVNHYAADDYASYADDFRQEAIVALYRAAKTFDLESTEVEFGLYAKICIENALVSYLRILIRNTVVEKKLQIGESTDDVTPADLLMREEALCQLRARIQSILSPFENCVFDLMAKDYKSKEIAQVLGKDTHSIENAVSRIRSKLRKELQ